MSMIVQFLIICPLVFLGGSMLGARSFSQKGGKIAKPVICIVLAVFFVRILWELLSA